MVELALDRLSLALNAKGATIELTVEVQDASHGEIVVDHLRSGGFSPDHDRELV